jgi:hypothetical protein
LIPKSFVKGVEEECFGIDFFITKSTEFVTLFHLNIQFYSSISSCGFSIYFISILSLESVHVEKYLSLYLFVLIRPCLGMHLNKVMLLKFYEAY